MSLPDKIDHDRAKNATLRVGRRKKASAHDFGNYRTVVLSAGTAIRQIGLPQYTAFGMSKGEAHLWVLLDLFGWLSRAPTTERLFQKIERADAKPAQSMAFGENHVEFMARFLQRNSMEIAALEAEAQQYLSWLKRLTEGVKKEQDRTEAEKRCAPADHAAESDSPNAPHVPPAE